MLVILKIPVIYLCLRRLVGDPLRAGAARAGAEDGAGRPGAAARLAVRAAPPRRAVPVRTETPTRGYREQTAQAQAEVPQ